MDLFLEYSRKTLDMQADVRAAFLKSVGKYYHNYDYVVQCSCAENTKVTVDYGETF